jgi:plasmid stabilization system protein ParE
MVLYKVRIRDQAFNELQDVVDYYNNINSTLAERFFNMFENALEILKINPHFQVQFDNIRSLPLHTFPYSIYFDINEIQAIVNVYAILHQALDPKTIQTKLK